MEIAAIIFASVLLLILTGVLIMSTAALNSAVASLNAIAPSLLASIGSTPAGDTDQADIDAATAAVNDFVAQAQAKLSPAAPTDGTQA